MLKKVLKMCLLLSDDDHAGGRNLNLIFVSRHHHPHLFHQNKGEFTIIHLVICKTLSKEKFDKIWSEWIISGGKTRSVKLMIVGKQHCLPIKIPPLSVDNDQSAVGGTEQWRWWTTFNMPTTFLLQNTLRTHFGWRLDIFYSSFIILNFLNNTISASISTNAAH